MKIYPRILKNVILPAVDRVLGTRYSYYLRQFTVLQQSSREQIEVWQQERLHRLILHVYKHVPFYRDFMQKENLRPEDILKPADLRLFPELTKAEIKACYEQFIPDNLNSYKYMRTATGGSTGMPFQYYLSLEAHSAVWAKKINMLEQHGFYLGEKYLALGSSQIVPNAKKSITSSVFHRLIRVQPLNAVNMDAAKCEVAIQMVKKQKLRMIYGYASAVYLLAKYVLENGVDLPVELCVTTSEKLTEQYEAVINQAFGCKVIDEYGARDAGVYSYRCSQGQFHMVETCLYHLSGGGSAGRGAIVATNLVNYAMPLINYNLEDIITMNQDECSCGAHSFCFEDILGRQSDVIILSNGRTITGPAFTVLFSKLPVKCYQIAWKENATLEIRILPDAGYSKDTEAIICTAIKMHVGDDYRVVFNYEYEFAPLQNGKRNYFITG